MSWLVAVIPWQYRLLALGAAIAALYGLGYYHGRGEEGDRQLAHAQEQIALAQSQTRVINRETVRVVKEYIKGSNVRKVERAESEKKVVEHAMQIPDLLAAELATERVRNINSAWGLEPRPNSAGATERVQQRAGTGKRAAQ